MWERLEIWKLSLEEIREETKKAVKIVEQILEEEEKDTEETLEEEAMEEAMEEEVEEIEKSFNSYIICLNSVFFILNNCHKVIQFNVYLC